MIVNSSKVTLTTWQHGRRSGGMAFHLKKCSAIRSTRAKKPVSSTYTLKGHTLDLEDSQSELPRPIKIGLGCVCGVEICTKLPEMHKKKSLVARVVSTFEFDNSGDPKYSVNGSNIVYLLS